jgi:hypothetical protein
MLIRPGKERDARGITMEKISGADGTDFPLCKKAGDRNRTDSVLDHFAVVVAVAE